MILDKLEIIGLRGFSTQQNLHFARPNGKLGSGLTILVGANNSGKSTVVESLRALSQRDSPSFTQGRRNRIAGDQVKLRLYDVDGNFIELASVLPGSSETKHTSISNTIDISKILLLPSRRTFEPYFGKGETDRTAYMANLGFPAIRTSSFNQFSNRLFKAQKNLAAFNKVLARVLNPLPTWSIDQHDTGQYFLKFAVGDSAHSSEGLGEGLVSLFFIIDALYDSAPGEIIIIDEPELSLHPPLQRRLANLLTEYASDRQIVLATHSPYFVNLVALENGATVVRAHLYKNQSRLSQLSEVAANRIAGLLTNLNNPHIFGLNAQEVFFLEDRVILVEGQEDVIFYPRVQDEVGITLQGTFFGWGVGGAENMERVARVLSDLGFEKVVGILDGNKVHLVKKLNDAFPKFRFFSIPAEDIRTKGAVPAKASVSGLLDEKNEHMRSEHISATRAIFDDVNKFLLDSIP